MTRLEVVELENDTSQDKLTAESIDCPAFSALSSACVFASLPTPGRWPRTDADALAASSASKEFVLVTSLARSRLVLEASYFQKKNRVGKGEA